MIRDKYLRPSRTWKDVVKDVTFFGVYAGVVAVYAQGGIFWILVSLIPIGACLWEMK